MVIGVVILFSDKKSVEAQEIAEILKSCGGFHITDNAIHGANGSFTIVSRYKVSDISLSYGIAVFCDESNKFNAQRLPSGIIGICEENNINALSILKKNRLCAITCGMSNKNTVTLSSFDSDTLIAAIQRSFTDKSGNEIEPCEFKVCLKKQYRPFSVLAAITVLLILGIGAPEF